MSSYFNRIRDHVQRGLDRRAGPFMSSSVELLATPFLEEVQELETMWWAFFDAFVLYAAEGDQLRILGALVGEDALDDPTEDFRLRIRLKIRANVSAGRHEDFHDILALLTSTEWRVDESPAHVLVTMVSGVLTFDAGALARILGFATAAGFDLHLVAAVDGEPAEDLFSFPSSDASVPGGIWPSSDATVLGDNWAGSWLA